MVQINPGDLPDLPVEQLAQFLLGCAREDPTLLARSNSGPVVRRDAEVRVPLRRPIDLTAAQDDAFARAGDEAERPIAPAVEPINPPARPIATPTRSIAAPARPIGAPAGPIEVTARPIVPSAIEIEAQARPADAEVRPFFVLGEPAGRLAKPVEALAGPVDPSSRSDLTARPTDALAGPSTRAIDASGLVDGLAGPIDATARLVAQKLQLRRPDARDDPELEELVSIAVACARRAEDAVQQAREISWMARRRMSVIAAVTGAGVLAASAVAVLDRYTGEQALPNLASAFVIAPVTANPGGEPSSSGSATRSDPVPAPAAGPITAPAKLADRAPVADVARAVAELSPPVSTAKSAPVAAAAPPAPASSAQIPVATAVSPPAKAAEPATPPPAVAEARAPALSPHLASPAMPPSTGQTSTGQNGNSSAGVPAGGTNVLTAPAPEAAPIGPVVAASLDAPPLQAAPPASHPVRHARRPVRRVVYYPSGPGVLLAQVVYGVRRNLYEIFH